MTKTKPIHAVKIAILTSILAVGGWAIFTGIVDGIGLTNLKPLTNILLGIGIVFITSYLGLRNIFN